MKNNMKALVIGATGIIGNNLVRVLLAEGIDVRAFSRGLTPSLNLEGLNVERFKGDAEDPHSLQKGMEGCDWVFHTAPYYPLNTFHAEEHRRDAMKGINTVIEAIKNSNSVTRFVYTSSLTTIGVPPVGKVADETTPYNLGFYPHPYFEVKKLMEDRVIEEAKKGLPAVIVNPTGCFGPYEMKPPRLCLIPQIVNRQMPAYIDNPMNVVDVADVGRGHFLAAQKGRIGERYILGGHNSQIGETIKMIAKVAGVKPPQIKAPLKLAVGLAYGSEVVSYFTKNFPARFPLLGIRFAEYGQHYSIEKAKAELGYTVSPMEPCFARAIAWYKKLGYC